MKKLTDLLHLNNTINVKAEDSSSAVLTGSLFCAVMSAVLTVLNIIKHADIAMTVATSVLTFGFFVTAFLGYRKELKTAKVLIIILCGAIFSMFALIGGNDGFAILWILLVPIIGSYWVGLKYGFIISLYFQIFLPVLFYTPLSELVKDYYSPTFMLRFPLLYLTFFATTFFLMWQRQELFRKLQQESYYDSLTGLKNRRCYNELYERMSKVHPDPHTVCFSFDVDQLKAVNDTLGHQAGDLLIQAAADLIKKSFPGADCYRTGGDEFIALSTNPQSAAFVQNLKDNAAQWKSEVIPSIRISAGYASAAENPDASFEELIVLSDSRMYDDKKRFYEEHNITR